MGEDVEDMVDGLIAETAKKDTMTATAGDLTAAAHEDALRMMQYNMEQQYQRQLEEERNRMKIALAKELAKTQGQEVYEISDSEEKDHRGRGAAALGLAGVCLSTGQMSGAAVPFGVQRAQKHTTVSSPYGQKEQKEQTKKDKGSTKVEDILESMEVPKANQPPDTGQWSISPLLGQRAVEYTIAGWPSRVVCGIIVKGLQFSWWWLLVTLWFSLASFCGSSCSMGREGDVP